MPDAGPLFAFLSDADEADANLLRARWADVFPSMVLEELSAAVTNEREDGLKRYREGLGHVRIVRFFDWLHRSSGTAADPVSGRALLAALEGMVFGATALWFERNTGMVEGAAEKATQWAQKSALAWSQTEFVPDPAQNAADGSLLSHSRDEQAEAGIDAGLAAWRSAAPNRRIGAARTWLRALRREMYGTHPAAATAAGEAAEARSCREIPLLSFHPPDNTARVTRLVLERVSLGNGETQAGECFPDPLTMALTPVSDAFRRATREAEDAARSLLSTAEPPFDVQWTLLGLDNAPASGGSHGAAFAILCVQLWQGEGIPPETVITGQVKAGADGTSEATIEAVAYVREKTRAALTYKSESGQTITRVLVPKANENEARAGASDAGQTGSETVVGVSSLRDCLPHLTDRLVRQAVARHIAVGETESICEAASERTGRHWATAADVERACLPAQLTLDFAVDGTLRETTARAWADLSNRYRRVLISGDPGTGKSVLLWDEVVRRCRRASRGDAAAGFAVLLSAAQFSTALIVAALNDGGQTRKGFAPVVAGIVGNRYQLSGADTRWVQRRIESGDCLVALDALDEADAEGRGRVRDALRQAPSTCRFVVTQRPSLLGEATLSLGEEARATLGAFSVEQMSRAVDAWFVADPSGGAIFRGNLSEQENEHYLRVLRVPLYLRIACQVVESAHSAGRETPRWRRRADLYEHLLLGLRSRWADRPPYPDRLQQRLFCTLAAEVAFELFGLPHAERPPTAAAPSKIPALLEPLVKEIGSLPPTKEPAAPAAVSAWDTARVQEAVEAALKHDPELHYSFFGRNVPADLLASGVLTAARNRDEEVPRLMFPHQTLGEYLAARALADKCRTPDETEIKRRLEPVVDKPEWNEIVVFLSGCLPDPVPLFDLLLADQRREAVARARVVLAAECLREVTP